MVEYVHRITMEIRDTKKGIKLFYVDKYLRPLIPSELGIGDELEGGAKVTIFNSKGK